MAVGAVPDGISRLGGRFRLSPGRRPGAFVAPTIAYYAVDQKMGFAMPMMIGTLGSLVVLIIAVFLGPETKGKIMTADLEVIRADMPA